MITTAMTTNPMHRMKSAARNSRAVNRNCCNCSGINVTTPVRSPPADFFMSRNSYSHIIVYQTGNDIRTGAATGQSQVLTRTICSAEVSKLPPVIFPPSRINSSRRRTLRTMTCFYTNADFCNRLSSQKSTDHCPRLSINWTASNSPQHRC